MTSFVSLNKRLQIINLRSPTVVAGMGLISSKKLLPKKRSIFLYIFLHFIFFIIIIYASWEGLSLTILFLSYI